MKHRAATPVKSHLTIRPPHPCGRGLSKYECPLPAGRQGVAAEYPGVIISFYWPCRGGGIGRHAVLRGQWACACVGSNPALGTTFRSGGLAPRLATADVQGDVAKWLRRRSAKPLCGGSNPPVASNLPSRALIATTCVFRFISGLHAPSPLGVMAQGSFAPFPPPHLAVTRDYVLDAAYFIRHGRDHRTSACEANRIACPSPWWRFPLRDQAVGRHETIGTGTGRNY